MIGFTWNFYQDELSIHYFEFMAFLEMRKYNLDFQNLVLFMNENPSRTFKKVIIFGTQPETLGITYGLVSLFERTTINLLSIESINSETLIIPFSHAKKIELINSTMNIPYINNRVHRIYSNDESRICFYPRLSQFILTCGKRIININHSNLTSVLIRAGGDRIDNLSISGHRIKSVQLIGLSYPVSLDIDCNSLKHVGVQGIGYRHVKNSNLRNTLIKFSNKRIIINNGEDLQILQSLKSNIADFREIELRHDCEIPNEIIEKNNIKQFIINLNKCDYFTTNVLEFLERISLVHKTPKKRILRFDLPILESNVPEGYIKYFNEYFEHYDWLKGNISRLDFNHVETTNMDLEVRFNLTEPYTNQNSILTRRHIKEWIIPNLLKELPSNCSNDSIKFLISCDNVSKNRFSKPLNNI